MMMNQPVAEMASTGTFHGVPLVAVDREFETRWAAWSARGEAQDRLVRRRFVVTLGVVALVGVIAFALLA